MGRFLHCIPSGDSLKHYNLNKSSHSTLQQLLILDEYCLLSYPEVSKCCGRRIVLRMQLSASRWHPVPSCLSCSSGPEGEIFNFSYSNKGSRSRMFTSLLELVAVVARTAPGGVIVFFPSFSVLSDFTNTVQDVPVARERFKEVLQAAPVFCESQQLFLRRHQLQPNGKRISARIMNTKMHTF